MLDQEANSCEIQIPRDKKDGYVNNKQEVYRFGFTKIFDQLTKQDEIFKGICQEIVDSAFDGYNGTLFAYG